MTPAEVDKLFVDIDADLGDVSDIIVKLRALLPMIEGPVKTAMKGGLINEASAAGQVLMHIGPLKTLLEGVYTSARQVKL